MNLLKKEDVKMYEDADKNVPAGKVFCKNILGEEGTGIGFMSYKYYAQNDGIKGNQNYFLVNVFDGSRRRTRTTMQFEFTASDTHRLIRYLVKNFPDFNKSL